MLDATITMTITIVEVDTIKEISEDHPEEDLTTTTPTSLEEAEAI